MRGTRRFSQAISEGDGISIIVDVTGSDDAAAAASSGADGLLARGEIAGLREATDLPIVWCGDGAAATGHSAGFDATVVFVDGAEDEGSLERLHAEALDLGLDCVVSVSTPEELELALERIDPEIVLLSARRAGDDDPVERVLELLQDVPAGKLAIADVPVQSREQVEELERAGVDGVVVAPADVAALAGGTPPEV